VASVLLRPVSVEGSVRRLHVMSEAGGDGARS